MEPRDGLYSSQRMEREWGSERQADVDSGAAPEPREGTWTIIHSSSMRRVFLSIHALKSPALSLFAFNHTFLFL